MMETLIYRHVMCEVVGITVLRDVQAETLPPVTVGYLGSHTDLIVRSILVLY
jgi:hypothetical protein